MSLEDESLEGLMAADDRLQYILSPQAAEAVGRGPLPNSVLASQPATPASSVGTAHTPAHTALRSSGSGDSAARATAPQPARGGAAQATPPSGTRSGGPPVSRTSSAVSTTSSIVSIASRMGRTPSTASVSSRPAAGTTRTTPSTSTPASRTVRQRLASAVTAIGAAARLSTGPSRCSNPQASTPPAASPRVGSSGSATASGSKRPAATAAATGAKPSPAAATRARLSSTLSSASPAPPAAAGPAPRAAAGPSSQPQAQPIAAERQAASRKAGGDAEFTVAASQPSMSLLGGVHAAASHTAADLLAGEPCGPCR
jgi:hypothetical protein